MTKCIFCNRELTDNTKPEHILLNALGGRKSMRLADLLTASSADRSATLRERGQLLMQDRFGQLESLACKSANRPAGSDTVNSHPALARNTIQRHRAQMVAVAP